MTLTRTGTASTRLREEATRDLSEEVAFRDAMMVAVAAGLGYGFDAYAVNIYGLVLPSILVSLAITTMIA